MKKRNKIFIGIIFGTIAGIVDVIPMLFQKLPLDANLSALSHWIITGFIIAITTLKISGWLKGLILAFILIIPIFFIVAWNDPISLIPIGIMTLILGPILGFLIEKFGE